MVDNNKGINLTTPAGAAVWPKLTKPDFKFNPDGVYCTELRLSPEEAAPIQAKVQALFDEFYAQVCREKKNNKLKKADLPIKPDRDDDGNETGDLLLNFKLKAKITTKEGRVIEKKPLLVDSKGKTLDPEKVSIWGGSRIKVAFEARPYFVPAVGVGISFQLKGVQVLELVSGRDTPEGLGFRKEDGFEVQAEETPAEPPKTGDDQDDGNVAASRF